MTPNMTGPTDAPALVPMDAKPVVRTVPDDRCRDGIRCPVGGNRQADVDRGHDERGLELHGENTKECDGEVTHREQGERGGTRQRAAWLSSGHSDDPRCVLDAGPCLNFFATSNQNIRVRVVGKGFRVPETVRAEVARRSRDQRDARFARAWNVWMRLESNGWIEVLSGSSTPSLLATEEVARALAVSTTLVRQLTLSGDLSCRRIGRLV